METLDTQSWIILAAVVALGLVAIGAWFYRRKQSHNLQERFGPEYGRTLNELGGRTKGESELKAREKRVERLDILPLAPPEAARFTEAWRALQSRFIDNPKGVVVEAEQLVRELMEKRGYPMGDFERRAGDIFSGPSRRCGKLPIGAGHRCARSAGIGGHRGAAQGSCALPRPLR